MVESLQRRENVEFYQHAITNQCFGDLVVTKSLVNLVIEMLLDEWKRKKIIETMSVDYSF